MVARNETNNVVTDLVNLDRVRSLLKSYLRRRNFLKKKMAGKYEKGTLFLFSQKNNFVSLNTCMTDIPSIVVENMPETPPMSSRDIASAGLELSPSPSDSRYRDLDNGRSMSVDLASGSRLQRGGHARRTSDYSIISMDMTKSP